MLTERDMTITEWIGRQGAVRAEHVMTRFSIGRTATYRRLHELAEFGLVQRHRLLYNDGGLLTATAEGLRCAGLDRLTPARLSLALVPHMIASAALAAELEPQLADETLLSDREHRAAENAAGQPIAGATVANRKALLPTPTRPSISSILIIPPIFIICLTNGRNSLRECFAKVRTLSKSVSCLMRRCGEAPLIAAD